MTSATRFCICHIIMLNNLNTFLCCYCTATNILTKQARSGSKGSFIGYSAGGLPLYNFTGEKIQQTSHSIALILKNGLRQILEESDSRKIFFFLCVNLVSCVMELQFWKGDIEIVDLCASLMLFIIIKLYTYRERLHSSI